MLANVQLENVGKYASHFLLQFAEMFGEFLLNPQLIITHGTGCREVIDLG